MTAFADIEDVEDVWRPLSTDEAAVAQNLLGYAAALIRKDFPDIDDRLADGRLDETLPVLASVQMVKRAMEHPGASVRSRSETIDDYSESITYRDDDLDTFLAVTAAEVALLAPRPTRPRVRVARATPGLW